ncbi:MAG: hypothetical protein ACI4A3_13625 [Lachnospiraceae bacterium]
MKLSNRLHESDIPILFTIMYEDKKMCRYITIVAVSLLMIPVVARGGDQQ